MAMTGYFECVVRAMMRGIQASGGPTTWLYRFNQTLTDAEGKLFGLFSSLVNELWARPLICRCR